MIAIQPTVYLVDDERSVLKSLGRLLASAGLKFVAHESADEFLDQFDPTVPGCLVLDVSMPGIDGLELQQALAARGSVLPIIFLTGQGDVPTSVRAMKRGATDFLTKPVDDAVLLAAIEDAFARNRSLRSASGQRAQVEERLALLSPREREVLELVVAGRLNKQIAGELGIVEQTIKYHRARVMRKMGVRSVAELVGLVERAGLKNE